MKTNLLQSATKGGLLEGSKVGDLHHRSSVLSKKKYIINHVLQFDRYNKVPNFIKHGHGG